MPRVPGNLIYLSDRHRSQIINRLLGLMDSLIILPTTLFYLPCRLRKKARYQELLDSEEQLKLFQRSEKLQQERISTIMKFLNVRDVMLNDADPTAYIKLQELVDHLSTFQFEIHGYKSISSDARKEQYHVPMANMLHWDRDIQERYRPSSVDDVQSFHYNLADGVNGIAISKNGSGFARVDLLVQQPRDSPSDSSSKCLLSGILAVQFASTSSRLSSASWTISQCHPSFSVHPSRQEGRQNGTVAEPSSSSIGHTLSSSSLSNDTLENQMIHPSVVSLDFKVSHPETTEANGPGMSI
jgi:hypothetical protein